MKSLTTLILLLALAVLTVTQFETSYEGRKQLVASQRSGCFRGARKTVDELNRDFVIYTADVTAPQSFRHAEATGILESDLDIAASLDTHALAGTPTLRWPALRGQVAATGFSCSRAYPAASVF